MKIAVYAIMKNEEENVHAWAETVADADHVTVLDTGSTDDTTTLLDAALRHNGTKSFCIHKALVDPWRFDVAHNTALALVPPDIDICIPLAADERMTGGWRAPFFEAVGYTDVGGRRMDKPVAPGTKFHYEYEFAKDFTFWHDRIHARRGFHWRYPFHEGLYPALHMVETHITVTQGFRISQSQNKKVDRLHRDIVLAEQALHEYPHDPRMLFYVGRQFMYAGQCRRALGILERYPDMCKEQGYEHANEHAWWADAVGQCWRAVANGSN